MEIKGIRLVRQELGESRSEDGSTYTYTVRASFVPFALADGRVADIEGITLDLLRAEGWQAESRTDLAYQATAEGGSPSLQQIAGDLIAWLGAELAGRMEAWVGRAAPSRA